MGKGGSSAGLFALLLLVVLAGGCGSSGDEAETAPQRIYPRVHGPSREFLIPGGDNIVQFFGREAPAERKEASRVIHAWMRARVAEDWKADCRYLSAVYSRSLVNDARQVSQGKATSCPQALEFFGHEASGTSGNTLTGPIDSFRVRGVRAYAQWHGPEEDWILPLRNEAGQWKIEAASPLGRTK
jgi:hypothetical protein